ncbi:MAG: hypothetical protein EON59_04145 [Alphaproteobacteria bacterium]|nr:MAG: hypothetical protein EON59_04145 [Alphaproteobacteria bacterium]
MSELKAELHQLYSDSSKHSVYQNIPDFVSAELGYTESIDEGWRGDRQRLAFLSECRTPAAGETWLDFGANTGFFTLSLAHEFPHTSFVAVEANPNHARFIERVARYFEMQNVEVIQRAVGLRELHTLPRTDYMLHLNVLHHAGHDFDGELVPTKADFADYAKRYFTVLREITGAMLFQLGSNWGGDREQPLIDARADSEKLALFEDWLRDSGWTPRAIAYAHSCQDGRIEYVRLDEAARKISDGGSGPWEFLDRFPGEFYRRPLFHCEGIRGQIASPEDGADDRE